MSKKKEEVNKEVLELNNKINELKNEVSIIQDKFMRSNAELVNYRIRKDTEVSNMLKYANEDLVLELLPIVDNFERAIKMDKIESPEMENFLSGFNMIYCQIIGALEQYGVKAIDGSNKEFDPEYHQAVVTEKKDGVEPGMVLEVLQKGYLLKDKIIRPAMVKVSE